MARTLLDDARDELRRARTVAQKEDYVLAQRQAAEKAWGYLVQHTDALLGLDHLEPKERHLLRRERLQDLEARSGVRLYESYQEIVDVLHGRCFYEGRCFLPEVERLVQAAAEFPHRVKEAQRAAARGGAR